MVTGAWNVRSVPTESAVVDGRLDLLGAFPLSAAVERDCMFCWVCPHKGNQQ
jgi:hypothetical protein